jgi:hypothetical protein
MHCAITLIAHAREEELRSPEEEQPWYRLEDWPQEWYRGDAIVEGRAKDILRGTNVTCFPSMSRVVVMTRGQRGAFLL